MAPSPDCSANVPERKRLQRPRGARDERPRLRRHPPLGLAAHADPDSAPGPCNGLDRQVGAARRRGRPPAPPRARLAAGARRAAAPRPRRPHPPPASRRRRGRHAGDPAQRSSTTCSEAAADARGSASIAANPVLIGAATTLVVIVAVFLAYNANSGLPFVPTYELNAEVPERGQPRLGNDVRVGGTRVGAVDDDHAGRRRTARSRAARPEARDDGQAAARRPTVIVRPRSALGLKYVQITQGHVERRVRGRRDDPAAPGEPQPVELDEFLDTFDDRRARPVAGNLDEFGNGLAGRGADLNRGDPGAQPAAARPRAGPAEPVGPADRFARLVPGARAHGARSWPRSSEQQAPLFAQPRHDVHRARRRRAALPPAVDRGGPPALTRRSRELPPAAAVPGATARSCSASCGRASRALRPPRRTSPTRSTSARRRCKRSRGIQPAPGADVRRARALRRGPAASARRARPDEHRAGSSTRRSPTSAGADGLQLRDAVVPQRREPAQRGRRERHRAALHHPRRAAGPQQRGRAVLGAGERARPRPTSCTPTRTRTPPRRASRRSARPATRSTSRAARSSATCRATRARQDGHDASHDAVMPRRRKTPTPTPCRAGTARREPVRGRPARARRARRRHRTSASPRTSRSPTASAVNAVFETSNSIRPNSPVRIAGVNVGKVKAIERKAATDDGDRDDGDQGQGPADPQGRDGEDPAADLPRGQLLRRPQARDAVRRRRSTTATRCRSRRPPRRCSSTRC